MTRPLIPGSVEEIAASPPGPAIGAFFDFDGTLIAGYSASAMASDRFKRRDISLGDIGRSMTASVQVAIGRADMGDFMRLTAQAWEGRSHAELVEMGDRLFIETIAGWVYPEARALVEAHQRRGHTVVLSSSATRYQIGGIARELGIANVLCTELEVEDGIVTGTLVEPALWGPGKVMAVRDFADQHGVDMGQSYFYADGDEDIGLMHLVGKPRPTNPRRKMEQAARRYGWPVQKFTSRGKPSLATRGRNVVGWASVAPFTAASVGIAAVRRNRRTAATDTSRRWLDLMLSTTGVQLNITGREHLSSHRPAVFVFNHRTDFDPLLAAAVVRGELVGLSRPRNSRSALSRALVQIADIVITADVDDAVSVATAAELVTTQGLSMLAAPERPRALGEPLGAFDPTAFHVAMAAGVPVVPVVIRNADLLGGRHAKVLRAGTVDVAVLAPISTSRWAERTINARITAVRKKFLATLDDWPSSD